MTPTAPEPGGACAQCGAVLVPSRHGGYRKRFCSPSCRNRFHNGRARRRGTGAAAGSPGSGPSGAPGPSEAPAGLGDRERTLEELYERLRADVAAHGTLLEGGSGLRLNPAVGELRRVIVELERLAERRHKLWVPPPVPDEPVGQGDELSSFLRVVSTPDA